jgi:hypothetical protein
MLLPTNSWNNFTPQLREPSGEEKSRKQVEADKQVFVPVRLALRQ